MGDWRLFWLLKKYYINAVVQFYYKAKIIRKTLKGTIIPKIALND